jgi:hypothetical protein
MSLLASSLALLLTTACPHPSSTNTNSSAAQPPAQDFNLPPDVTPTRISNGQEIVYAQIDQANDTYDFFLAKPRETEANHELIASVPASDFGFTPGEQLVLPQTISFSDNLQRAVVGFTSGSYLLHASTLSGAQLIGFFYVTPLTVFGQRVFNPTITPFGSQFAFQTTANDIYLLNTSDFLAGNINPVLLGTGVSPLFGFNGELGFANPTFTSYYVSNFAQGTIDTFGLTGFIPFSFPNMFSTFEAGLSPLGISSIGTFMGTSPLAL